MSGEYERRIEEFVVVESLRNNIIVEHKLDATDPSYITNSLTIEKLYDLLYVYNNYTGYRDSNPMFIMSPTMAYEFLRLDQIRDFGSPIPYQISQACKDTEIMIISQSLDSVNRLNYHLIETVALINLKEPSIGVFK